MANPEQDPLDISLHQKLADHFHRNYYSDMPKEDIIRHLHNPEILDNGMTHIAEVGHDDNDLYNEVIAKKHGNEKPFTKNGRWEIVKDLKNYRTHSQGGVDLEINKDGVTVQGKNSNFKVDKGLVMSDSGEEPIDKRIKGNFKPEHIAKIKEHEDFMANFIKSPMYKDMIQKQGLSKEDADKLIEERYNNVKSTTYGNKDKDTFFDKGNAHRADTSDSEYDKRGYTVGLPKKVFGDIYDGSYGNTANVITHELTHRSLGFSNNKNITKFEEDKASNIIDGVGDFEPSMGSKDFNPNSKTPVEDVEKANSTYWGNTGEVLARLNGVRKMLYDEKVYNPNTEKIDEDKYNLFKNKTEKRLEYLKGLKNKDRTRNIIDEEQKLLNIRDGLRYINDSIDSDKSEKDIQNQDKTNKKVIWMLNNLVHNQTNHTSDNV